MNWKRPWPQPDEREPDAYLDQKGVRCFATVRQKCGQLYICCEIAVSVTHPQPPALVSQARAREILLNCERMEEIAIPLQWRVVGDVREVLGISVPSHVHIGPGFVDQEREDDDFEDMGFEFTEPNVTNLDGKIQFWISLSEERKEYITPEIVDTFGLVVWRNVSRTEYRIGVKSDSMSYLIFHRSGDFRGSLVPQTRGVIKLSLAESGEWQVAKMNQMDAVLS